MYSLQDSIKVLTRKIGVMSITNTAISLTALEAQEILTHLISLKEETEALTIRLNIRQAMRAEENKIPEEI